MTTQLEDSPLTIYLMDGDREIPIPGVDDFTLTTQNPEAHEEAEEGSRASRRRARQMRRRRATHGDLALTLLYDPSDELHQDLMAAGEEDVILTLRLAMRGPSGQPAITEDIDCAVASYCLSYRPDSPRRVSRRRDEGRDADDLQLELRLRRLD